MKVQLWFQLSSDKILWYFKDGKWLDIPVIILQQQFLKKYFIYLFLEGKGGRKRRRETSVCGCLSRVPSWVLARNPGMCPDWELNWQTFDWQAGTYTSQGSNNFWILFMYQEVYAYALSTQFYLCLSKTLQRRNCHPFIPMEKLRFREVKQLAQGLIATLWCIYSIYLHSFEYLFIIHYRAPDSVRQCATHWTNSPCLQETHHLLAETSKPAVILQCEWVLK